MITSNKELKNSVFSPLAHPPVGGIGLPLVTKMQFAFWFHGGRPRDGGGHQYWSDPEIFEELTPLFLKGAAGIHPVWYRGSLCEVTPAETAANSWEALNIRSCPHTSEITSFCKWLLIYCTTRKPGQSRTTRFQCRLLFTVVSFETSRIPRFFFVLLLYTVRLIVSSLFDLFRSYTDLNDEASPAPRGGPLIQGKTDTRRISL